MKIWPLWRSVIMFGKFEKKFGRPNNEEKKLLGECISYPATNGCFFLRLLLTVVPGMTSFEHLQTIDDIEHPTFQVVCGALGLLQDDTEWDTCMREACIDQDVKRLRNLFVALLLLCSPLNPEIEMGKILK